MQFILENFFDFLELGGEVLWLLFFITFFLWFFIFEKILFFKFILPNIKNNNLKKWKKYSAQKTWLNDKIRRKIISESCRALKKNISSIKTLVIICPLFGLLGTVTGMISVFNVMAIAGTGNSRMMASGISMATIPTMAGMLTALSGIYFSSFFQNKIKKEVNIISEDLQYED